MASSNSILLSDYANMSNSPLVRRFTYALLMNGNVLQDIPFIDYKSMVAVGGRVTGTGLATPAYRSLNEDPASTKSVPTQFQEQAYIAANNFDIDKVILEDVNRIQDPWSFQFNAFAKAFTYDINNKFLNNNHVGGDAKAPVGIRWRLDNPTDYGIPSELKIDFAVDLSGTITAANALKFWEQFQSALDFLGATTGGGVTAYCNDYLIRKISTATKTLGTSGGFDITRDQYGRLVMSYNGCQIRDLGRKSDQTTRIITATETNAGVDGSSTYTSIYFVKWSTGGDGIYGWQFRPMEEAFSEPRWLDGGVQKRVTFDWPYGLFQEDIRAFARGYDIKVA